MIPMKVEMIGQLAELNVARVCGLAEQVGARYQQAADFWSGNRGRAFNREWEAALSRLKEATPLVRLPRERSERARVDRTRRVPSRAGCA